MFICWDHFLFSRWPIVPASPVEKTVHSPSNCLCIFTVLSPLILEHRTSFHLFGSSLISSNNVLMLHITSVRAQLRLSPGLHPQIQISFSSILPSPLFCTLISLQWLFFFFLVLQLESKGFSLPVALCILPITETDWG